MAIGRRTGSPEPQSSISRSNPPAATPTAAPPPRSRLRIKTTRSSALDQLGAERADHVRLLAYVTREQAAWIEQVRKATNGRRVTASEVVRLAIDTLREED